ncbi:MAG: Mrp/NBP35 family ATP-binding protein [Planctomycetota bacterium]|jgi:ATP-binding protein involved in chromosome partitioning|nr:Mrp/NBP35 family ATP-binding protein [Planctomycetota bacterium]
MPSDKSVIVAAVNQVLSEIPLPGTPSSIVKSGVIQRVIVHEGEVTVVVQFPAGLTTQQGSISEQIEDRVRSIDGVEKVTLLHRSETPAPTVDPAAGAPGVGGSAVGAQDIPGVKNVIAVASGKGGVGKSTVAVNLALALAARGLKTGLLDADVYGPSTPKMLGTEDLKPRATEKDTILPIEVHGLKTMSIGYLLEDDSPVIWRGPMVTGLLRQFLFQVEWGQLDYLVLDLPPGTGDAQLTLVQSIALTGGVIVTTPQDVALLDVQRGIQMFQRTSVPILGVIENMSGFECSSCGQITEIFRGGGGRDAARRYQVPFLGKIPLEPSIALSGDGGTPMMKTHPDGSLGKVMISACDQIVELVSAQ